MPDDWAKMADNAEVYRSRNTDYWVLKTGSTTCDGFILFFIL